MAAPYSELPLPWVHARVPVPALEPVQELEQEPELVWQPVLELELRLELEPEPGPEQEQAMVSGPVQA